MKALLTILLMPIMAMATLPAVFLIASIMGAVTFQWWMLLGLIPIAFLGE